MNDRPIPFQFDTKATTLERLGTLVSGALFCDQEIVPLADWKNDRDEVVSRMLERFDETLLAVRSSAVSEDGWESSRAGEHLSLIDVKPQSEALTTAIDDVFSSYRPASPEDQVLVQSMVKEVVISGVVLTRDLDTGGPYYVINYDDFSGRTDTVTGGSISKMVMVHRACPEALHSSRMRKLVSVVQEIEEATGSDKLDIEFCATADNTFYVLQVRPLAASRIWQGVSDDAIDSALAAIRQSVKSRMKPQPGLAGATTILGEMPDWNPAEMIGKTPRPLALSLYKHLITDGTWSEARARMGYRRVDRPLLVDFLGRPYIDVRLSLNSFLPADLDEDLAHRLVDFQLATLSENKEMHDKIEFEIAITCHDLDFTAKARTLKDADFSGNDIDDLARSLGRITGDALNAGSAGLNGLLSLSERFFEDDPRRTSLPPLERARALLSETIEFGTLPFSILARHAFIAVSMLRSLVARDALTPGDMENFMHGVHTVASDLVGDMVAMAGGRMEKTDFLARYGHLRPGTYDILSWRYDEKPELYLSSSGKGEVVDIRKSGCFELTAERRSAVASCLSGAGYSIEPEFLFDYIATAIAAREQAKFAFTRGISDALAALGEWGETAGFSRDDLSFIPIDSLLSHQGDLGRLREEEAESRQVHNVARAIRLHHLIVEPDDIDVVSPARGQPTFITNKSVTAAPIFLHANKTADLKGRIVLIESADPGFDWIFSHEIAGLITQYGGANSHMAIRCAEFGLPAAIGCAERTFSALLKSKVIELNCAAHRVSGH